MLFILYIKLDSVKSKAVKEMIRNKVDEGA